MRDRIDVLLMLGLLGVASKLRQLERLLTRAAKGRFRPDLALAMTRSAYGRRRHYVADWHQDLGLFDFENHALDRFFCLFKFLSILCQYCGPIDHDLNGIEFTLDTDHLIACFTEL